jgi:hypothetical protein
MGSSNATLSFTIQGAKTGVDATTRQPIYGKTVVDYRVFVRQDRRPTAQVFPGADETLQVLKGAFVKPLQPAENAIRESVCVIKMDNRPAITCQFKPLGDQWGSTQKVYGRRIEGHRFHLLLKL